MGPPRLAAGGRPLGVRRRCEAEASAFARVPGHMTPRELMTDYLAAAKRGDWDTAFRFLADDLLIHIPGR